LLKENLCREGVEKEKQMEGILESLSQFTALTRLRFAICSGYEEVENEKF